MGWFVMAGKMTVNHWVPGSSPGRGANICESQQFIAGFFAFYQGKIFPSKK